MYGRVSYDKENIYINNDRILGITSFTASVDFSKNAIVGAGIGYFGQVVENEIPSSFSFVKFITSGDDSLLQMIGEELNGKFLYQSSNEENAREWRAISGKLNSFELNCSVGNIPESTFSFDILKQSEFTESIYSPPQEFSESIQVVRPGDLVISGSNNLFSNRLQSLKYSFNIPYKKKFLIGSGFNPIATLNDPIEVLLNMEFDLDNIDNEFSNFELCHTNFSGVFTFNRCGNQIKTFSITGAELIDYSVNGSVGENAKFSCSYRTYVNSFDKLKEFFI